MSRPVASHGAQPSGAAAVAVPLDGDGTPARRGTMR
jgi:hypothetical protein